MLFIIYKILITDNQLFTNTDKKYVKKFYFMKKYNI